MNIGIKELSIGVVLACVTSAAAGQSTWTPEQQEIIDATAQLSSSTALGGEGADTYARSLAEDFSRWTLGSELLTNKESWVEGVREWFDDGWRVSKRESQYLQILVRGETAYTRRIVKETYLGPEGDTSDSRAALAEVWRLDAEGWRLHLVNVHPLDNP